MRLIIYDDQLLFSEALSSLLMTRGHEVVACPTTPEEAARLIASVKVDACLVDVRPDAAGAPGTIAMIKATVPQLPVIVLSAELDAAALWRAIESGADGVCLKLDGIEEIERVLVQALNASPSGKTKVWSRGASSLARRGAAARRDGLLTPRERSVLGMLVRGAGTSEIATQLHVGEATVRTHLQHLFNKFGVHSRLALVACAVRSELVPLEVDSPYMARSS